MLASRLAVASLVAVSAALLVTGCGENDKTAGVGNRVTVVATTTQAADFTRNVGGQRVEVVQLLAPNADPHEYEVRPRDVQALTDADLIVRSGGDVDKWLDDAIKGAGTKAPVLKLSDKIQTLPAAEEGEEFDPHWWQDPRNAVIATGEIRAALDEADASHASLYDENARTYTAKLTKLDSAVAACIGKVPDAQRKLVTTHDALGYYAKRYGIDVIGTVIPSLSTAGQPSAGETAKLVNTIKDTGVKAIFAESSVNPKVEAAIARETGAKVGKALWADTLGPESSDGATYTQSIASNTAAMVDGFTGGAVTCSLPGS
jgi:zinc/manganese transport system substrate-binding protein